MATLQSINNVFYIRFRFAGRPYRRSLGIAVRDDAEDTRKQVEVNLHRITVGLIPPRNSERQRLRIANRLAWNACKARDAPHSSPWLGRR